MTRFTSIGMPRKTFVASAAEESSSKPEAEAGPSTTAATEGAPPKKKSKRRGTRGKVQVEGAVPTTQNEVKKGWGRDPSLARRTKLSAQHGEERRQRRENEKNNSTTCFACRSVGHAARDCPNVLLALETGGEGSAGLLGEENKADGQGQGKDTEKRGMKKKAGKKGGDIVGNKCYRCNGTDHSLGSCPEPVDPTNPTPFATCYICLASGHLSSLCPSNPGRGIYVNGGSCKVCSSTAHQAKDCPEETKMKREDTRPRRGEIVLGAGDASLGADEDDFMAESRIKLKEGDKGKGKKKHLPNNNGPRTPYSTFAQPAEGDLGAVATTREVEAGAERKVAPMPKSKPKVIAF